MAGEITMQSGFFTSTGNPVTLNLRFDPDWLWVFNTTEAAAANAAHGVQYFSNPNFWTAGGTGDALVYVRNGAANAIDLTTSVALGVGGVTFIDYGSSSTTGLGPIVAATAITNNTPPRVTGAGNGTGFVTGDVIRMYNPTGAQQLGGYDFTITFVNNNRIDLTYASPIVAGTNVTYRKVPTQSPWYPSSRQIANISRAVNARVTFTVTHNFQVGQLVFFNTVPAQYGMTQISGLTGTIVAVGNADANGYTNTVDLDIDSSAFTAFAFPVTAVALADTYNIPAVFPAGENTALALAQNVNILSGAQVNTAFIGLSLAAGITSPAGSAGDLVSWMAGQGNFVL